MYHIYVMRKPKKKKISIFFIGTCTAFAASNENHIVYQPLKDMAIFHSEAIPLSQGHKL